MPRVYVPATLRHLTAGQEIVEVSGTRVGEVISALERLHPGIQARLFDGEALRPGIAVVVGTEVARLGLREPVPPDGEVHFLPAIGGGSRSTACHPHRASRQ